MDTHLNRHTQVSIAASLSFIPSGPSPFPSYRGLAVESVIRALDAEGTAVGPALTAVRLGTVVAFVIQVGAAGFCSSVRGRVRVRALTDWWIGVSYPQLCAELLPCRSRPLTIWEL